jgi:MFS family permease
VSAVPAPVLETGGPRRRRGFAPLPLLTLINFVNYFDRQIMYGLFPLVGKDMALSDTALGALGFGNLLVFALSSIISGPATRRFGARAVVATGVIVWSLATLGSALAPNYPFLLVMRALVGVGEGAFGPSANALLCADAPPEKRGRAMGIFNVGMALGGAGGGAFALLAAGVLAPYITWRGSLLIAGLPGFVLALLSVRMAVPADISEEPRLPARRYMVAPVYVLSMIAGSLANFGAGAIIAWMPTLLLRERHIAPSLASAYVGLVAIVCGAGRRARRRLRGRRALEARASRPRAHRGPVLHRQRASRPDGPLHPVAVRLPGAHGRGRVPVLGLQRPHRRGCRRDGPARLRDDAAGELPAGRHVVRQFARVAGRRPRLGPAERPCGGAAGDRPRRRDGRVPDLRAAVRDRLAPAAARALLHLTPT